MITAHLYVCRKCGMEHRGPAKGKRLLQEFQKNGCPCGGVLDLTGHEDPDRKVVVLRCVHCSRFRTAKWSEPQKLAKLLATPCDGCGCLLVVDEIQDTEGKPRKPPVRVSWKGKYQDAQIEIATLREMLGERRGADKAGD